MSTQQIQEQLNIEQILKVQKRIGIKRKITQISDTITFELKRSKVTFALMLIVYFAVFLLFFIIYQVQEAQGVKMPKDSLDYFLGYFDMLGILIIISTALFGGAIVAEDFQKQTGNLLFPKVGKSRLLIGRVLSKYALNAVLIIFYYLLVAYITNLKYGEIPKYFLDSMGWALLYTFMIFSFVILMSSINKSKSAAIIISILFLLIVFQIIQTLLMVLKVEGEPWYILTYYENIITASLNMPDPRWQKVTFGPPNQTNPVEFIQWLTPSPTQALIGMPLFSLMFLIGAFLIYKRRQSKNE